MMQQIKLSPVKFSKEEIVEQEEELNYKTNLLVNTVSIDEVTVLFFNRQADLDIQPEREFCSIIQQTIPSIKAQQLEVIQRIAYCFYSMLVQNKLENLPSIQICFERYLQSSTFVSQMVHFHQQIRQWCQVLLQYRNFIKSRQTLQALLNDLKESREPRLKILEWKMKICLIIFDIISQRLKIQRSEIIKLIKQFKDLKRQNKISTKPILNAFKFIVKYFLSTNNDIYIFFQREMKIWCQEIVDNTLIQEMKNIIDECEQMSANSLKIATRGKMEQFQSKTQQTTKKINRKIVMNTLSPHLFSESNQEAIVGRRYIRRRLSKQKQENFQKKINHFLKIRENIQHRSMESSKTSGVQRNSISLTSVPRKLKLSIKIEQRQGSVDSVSRFALDQAMKLKNTIRFNNIEDKKSQHTIGQASRISLSTSKHFKIQTRRPRQIYQKIMERQKVKNIITIKHLKQEMNFLQEINQQRCNISLKQILRGQVKNKEQAANIKFKGASQDNQFGNLDLTFVTIFNQQMGNISFTLRKLNKQSYLVNCSIKSTYCNYPITFSLAKKNSSEFTLNQLNQSVVSSVIYYEALQERVQRKYTIFELQAMEELIREFKQVELSQLQLIKLLLLIDLLQSQFFWYYTKSNYISGCRLERRTDIDFEDESAFAVSLGKFKSDYDSCLGQIVLVENIQSLVQTCIYLSHGRKIVYKSLRKIKQILYLEVISVSDQVYLSFERKDKKPYFENTRIIRNLLKVSQFTKKVIQQDEQEQFHFVQLIKEINIQQFFNQEDSFIFFMKNIVENFIQKKYLLQIQRYLSKLNLIQNYEIFDEKIIAPFKKHHIEIITNNDQLCELKQFKPSLHSSLRHLKQILIKYCQLYQLNLCLYINKKEQHIIFIQKKAYIAHQTTLENGLKIVKIFKRKNGENYNLFLYHQRPTQLILLRTPFQSRFVMAQKNRLIGNLIRRQKAQMLISDDSLIITKIIMRYSSSYCYVSVSECQSICCWRFDYYFPYNQTQYSTFLDQQIYFQCLEKWGRNDNFWQSSIHKINIDLQKGCIWIINKSFSLFRSIKKMFFYEDIVNGMVQLIQLQQQFYYLITNFNQQGGQLCIGKVQNVMYLNNKLINSSLSSSRQSIKIYDNIINHIYYKIMLGKLPSETINPDYFKKEFSS